MKTMNILLIIALAVITKSIDVNAQFTIRKNILYGIDLENNILYVETKKLPKKLIGLYKGKYLSDSIKRKYDYENKLLQDVILDNWYIHAKTEELTVNEISNRIKNKQETWYLKLHKHTDKFFDRRVHKLKKYYSYSHYELSLYKNKKEVISIPLVNSDIYELDLQFALNTIQSLIVSSGSFKNMHNYTKEANASAYIIKEKTLLVSEKQTSLSLEYIQLFYKGKMKITSEQEILQHIRNRDEQYAYLMLTINDYSDKPSFNHMILDCANNKPLLVYRYSTAFIKPCKHTCDSHKYDEKHKFLFGLHFKKYQKIINSQIAI